MNKVFKVIWSEARNAYVVVSEIAKNHGSKSCSTKKLLAMLIATGVMTCASMAPAMAEDAVNLAPDATKIAIGEGAVASGKGSVVAIGQKASASGEGSVAIGEEAVASGLVGIAIGRDAVASGVDSIAIGSDTKATQTFSVAVGNDIGFTAYAGTAVGQQAYASGDNATAIGTMTNVDAEYKASHGDWRKAGAQSTAIGAYAGSWGVASTAVGSYSKAEGELATAIGYKSQANVDYGTALGDYSEVKAGWGVAIGASSVADRKSRVVGLYAPDEDKDSLTWKANAGAVSVGSSVEGEEITRQITNVAAGSADTDAVNVAQLNAVKAAAGKKVSLVDGENTKATLVKDDATGTQYKVDVDLSKYAKTEDVAVVYDKDKTSLRSTNASVAENAIALGKGASAVKNSIAIGNGAYTQDGTLTRGQSVALGNGAVTGAKSTSIGSNAVGGREGTITIGANANNGSLYATVIGTDSKVNYMTRNSGAAATIVGAKSEIKNDNKSYSGVANGIFGSANTIENSNGVTIQGSGNTVTNAYKNMSGLDFNLGGVYVKKDAGAVGVIGGMNTVSNQIYTNVIGFGNTVAGDADNISHDVFVAGSRNNLSKVSDSIVMGNDNTISDRSNVISFGHKNTISASNAVAIGNGASVSVEGGVALGVGSVADRANAVSVGSTGANRQIINVAAGTEGTDAVNVSQLQKVSDTANAGWNLYTNGVATEATNVKPGEYVGFSGDKNISVSHDGTKVKVELNDELKDIKSIIGAGEGAGSISFADGGKVKVNDVIIEKGGKITGVAAGTADTDAVNYGQLKDVKAEAGKHTTLSNGKNTTVESTVKDGQTDYKVNVAGDLTDITSVANGDSKINLNKDSIIISNGNKYFAITNSGIGMSYIGADYSAKSIMLGENGTTISGGLNVAGSKITGVAAGVADTDAVNVSQLKKVSDTANAGWNLATNGVATKATNVKPGDYVDFSGDKNISVSHDGTNVKVELKDELKDIKSIIGAGEGAGSISFADGGKVKVNDVIIEKGGKITGVAAGTADTDAVNYGQLKDVKAEAGKHTTLSNGKNTTVESTVKDGQTDYKVNVAGDLTDITSVANGDSKINLNKDSIIISNGNKYFAITNSGIGMSYIGADYSAKSIMLGENGTTISGGLNVAGSKITGVAAGEVSSTSTDAVNGSQLHAVKTELQTSDKHLVGNPASADGYYKPDANGDISLRVEDQNKNGYDVVIKDVASKAELGDVANRVTNVENKVTQIETDVTTIKTDITTIKTDINNINTRVDNVEALAGKHTTLEKNGTNINVEETVVDGQKNYKVNLNKDITLGDENGNNVSISGTNGTITATGDITTANRINAANGGKLADIDVTGNKLSNGNSSITLDGTNVKVNDKVTVDKDGKISGVAKGDISNTSTDAVNGSQLYDTNTHITNVENQVISNSNRINQLGNRVNKVGAGAAALAALHPMDFDPDDKLTFSAGYGNYAGENAAAIGAYYRPDEKVMFSVAGTVGNGENMVNAGVSFALDRTNHVSNSRTALAREVIDLRGQLAVMGAKMAKMEKAFGMLDETKTKLFPDVPANHWAYEYIAKLAGNGYIEGYPDGNFGGDRLMTRYEFAAMLYRAIEKGAALEEKIIKEFEPELGRIRVDRISGEDGDRDKIERVRVNDTKGERDHYGNKLAK